MYSKIYLQRVHVGTNTNPDYIKKKILTLHLFSKMNITRVNHYKKVSF